MILKTAVDNFHPAVPGTDVLAAQELPSRRCAAIDNANHSKQTIPLRFTNLVRMETKSSRVLVVDDHRDFLQALGLVLELLGHQPSLVSEPGSALERARHELFDVLIVDVHLLGMSGWHLVSLMREEGRLPPLVISMSTWNTPADFARSRDAGCRVHFQKPFKVEELEKLLLLPDYNRFQND